MCVKSLRIYIEMKKILILLLCAAALSSCATARFYSGFKPSAYGDLALLEPISHQFYLDSRDKEYYSDSLSIVSENLMAGLTPAIGVPVNALLPLDSLQREEAEAFMEYVAAHDRRLAGDFKIPTALDEVLEESGYRYGLLLFADGVSRDVGDYIGKAALGMGLGILTAILTMGMVSVYTYPTPAVSLMYAAVLDSETDRIVFYNLREYEDLNTTSEKSVRRQLSHLLKDFRK